ncbi:MAG TPA: NUDIX hydrolase [Gaiellaceae bacterium]|nr:NUDIX hydrolase [Gaiellaceae bacterium]
MIEHPPSVVLVVTDGDDVICVSQHRPGAAADVLELPAGMLEPGESPRAAADRELAEECGLAVAEWVELGSFWAAPAYSTERVTVLAGTCSGLATGIPDDDEEIAVVRLPLREVLGRVEDASSIAALALALR